MVSLFDIIEMFSNLLVALEIVSPDCTVPQIMELLAENITFKLDEELDNLNESYTYIECDKILANLHILRRVEGNSHPL